MSQVMSSALLGGAHAVCLAPHKEPNIALRPAPSPNLPPQCPYYTMEGWGSQTLMAPTPCKAPSSRPQQAPQARAKGSCLLPSPSDQASGTSDISLESLHQMILELDPTFQLFPPGISGLQAEPAQSTTLKKTTEDPEALDIKYIEVTSTRSRCHDSPQRCSNPFVNPLSGSPRSGGIFLSRDVPRETRSSNESLIFSGNQGLVFSGNQHPPLSSSGTLSSHLPQSPSISIPCTQSKALGPHGSGSPLVASPGLDKGLGRLTPQRNSRVSVLSASPASDVSYVFGSSQSLLYSSLSSHQSSSRSLESPSSSSSSLHSLGPASLCTKPSDLHVPCNPTLSTGQPRATHSLPLAKEHASSCPPSITNSMVDIPIVLINGYPEPGSPPPQQSSQNQSFARPGATISNNSCLAAGNHSQNLPDASLMTSLEGSSKDLQPTMKFVMDTSKYWFKPNITREQAIELLRKEEPGTFVVRDSSSYRGSFGLALKVQEAPASAQPRPGDDSCDLIRHFLIESSAKGVHLKGADEEPYFGSLSAFVCQHSIMALALPCKLSIPHRELGGDHGALAPSADSLSSSLKRSAGCHALYLTSVSVETLTGAMAVQKAISTTLELDVLPTPTVVHFKVTEQGITLTDLQRKVFFRRHYPLTTLRFCGMDPEQRKWQKYCKPSWIFGFVAKSQTEPPENVCHLFVECDTAQPASQVISLVGALLQDAERM
ncbi:tensin-4 isoform 2-T2 [Rhynchocyon petersi]